LTIVAMHGFQYFGENSGDAASRVIANIIVGIGFIGAGAILRREDHVIGTTTAATLWLVAGIGIAVGLNFLFAAVIAALFGYIILTAFLDFELRVLDDSTKKSHGKKVLNSDEADR
jgi:putative Mg2+ transporter-C (MgtC) family protein